MEISTRFFSGKNIKIETTKIGVFMNVTMPDGEVHTNVEPRRYFPISNIYNYISIVKPPEKDKDKPTELLIIKDIEQLDSDSKAALLETLDKYYMIPKILDVIDSKNVYGILQWVVMTDRGKFAFDIRDLYSSIKQLPDGRILILDANDNRYEISDYKKLSKKGQNLLLGYL